MEMERYDYYSFVKESKLTTIRFDKLKPQVVDMKLQFTDVSDAIDFINVGTTVDYRLWDTEIFPARLGTTEPYVSDDYKIVKA